MDPGRRRSACRSASSLGVPEPRAARSPSASLLVGKDMGQRAALGPLPLRCLLLPHEAVSPGRSGPHEKDPPLGAQTHSHLLCTSRHVPSLLWGRVSPSVNCKDLAKPAGEPLPVLRQVSTLATTTAATAPSARALGSLWLDRLQMRSPGGSGGQPPGTPQRTR